MRSCTDKQCGLFAVVLVASVSLGTATADELHVPSEYGTIQAAVDAASEGDVVVVADGVYSGPGNTTIDVGGYDVITVRSANGPETCTIDGGGTYRAFELDDLSPESCIRGFTIVNCGGHNGSEGGAILCKHGMQGRIEDCILINNASSQEGGAIYCRYSSDSTPVIQGCKIIGNTAEWGGGVYCELNDICIVNCVFENNIAQRGGGAICCQSRPLIINSVISNNYGGWYGGAICARTGTGPHALNCTITENEASWYGGGIYAYNADEVVIENSIIAHNEALLGSQWALEHYSVGHVAFSDIYGGDPLYVSSLSIVLWGDGNLEVDPLFIDSEEGDFRLMHESLCVDAGSNGLIAEDCGDLDGDGDTEEPIPFDFAGCPRVSRFVVDMGAFEIPYGDMNCDRVLDFDDINPFVLAISGQDAYANQFPDCDWLFADCNADGTVDFDDITAFVAILGQ